MKNISEPVRENPLFAGIEQEEVSRMLGCLSATQTRYKKGGTILLTGGEVNSVGIILSGGANILSEDADGRAALISELKQADIFGEVFVCAGLKHSPVTVQATRDTEVMFVNYKKIITVCSSACHFHARLIENMLRLVAAKCLTLNRKIEILSKRTIRGRLLLFFDMERDGKKEFSIPYGREELARYLCVDRSALSNELSKMKSEGLVDFEKNTFTF